MSDNYSVFGYGSLILPESLIARFEDNIDPIDPVYGNRTRFDEDGIVRDSATKIWNEDYIDRLERYPVRVKGYIRTYTIDSPRGGAMLEAQYTGDYDDYINGVIYTDLTKQEYDGITGTEADSYNQKSINNEDIETYSDIDLPQFGTQYDTNKPIIYTPDTDNLKTLPEQTRNNTYHSRILMGIESLRDAFGDEVAEKFLKNFQKTTYEFPSVEVDQ